MPAAASSIVHIARASMAFPRVGAARPLVVAAFATGHPRFPPSAGSLAFSVRASFPSTSPNARSPNALRSFSVQLPRLRQASPRSPDLASFLGGAAMRRSLPPQFFFFSASRRPDAAAVAPLVAAIRHASTKPDKPDSSSPTGTSSPSWPFAPPRSRSRFLNLFYRALAMFGAFVAFIGLGVVAFFVYDASTYKHSAEHDDIAVSSLALNPRHGGPKNLPLYEVQIDDADCDERLRTKDKPKLVILGGGWGSVALLKELNPDDYHVTVISPTNYFLFTPMLPSATVGTLELKSLVEPIRRILARVHGHFLRARAVDVDFSYKLVEVSQTDHEGREIHFYVPYDKLVLAVGSITNPHGVKGLSNCHFLKDIDDARKIRNKIVQNLEIACLPTTPDDERRRLLSFVVSGGGPTGVEFAAELYDMLNEDLVKHFPLLLRNEISVHLIQSRSHILNTYDETVSKYAEEHFARDQVEVLTNSRVSEVKPDRIIFTQMGENGEIVTKELPMGLCLWSTGVSQTSFCQHLAAKLGPAAQSNQHALETDTHLRLNGTPLGDVYAIGDCSTVQNNVADHIVSFVRNLAWKHGQDPETLEIHFADWRLVAADVKKKFPQAVVHLRRLDKLFAEFDKDHSGTLDFGELRELLKQIDSKLTSLPATAQRAHQQGLYLAHKFNKMAREAPGLQANEIRDGDLDAAVYKAFEYKHLGSLAYIGNSAVFDLGKYNVSGGLWAVYAWRSVYFAQSVSMRTRILMMMDWAKRGLFGRDLVSF
ncbi:NADH-ubiquinone oxidoreductase [Niveomyces insectorum RCEF 264]|uniref:NADH-ubiquinone oxidoreductase n=1 Tax=Niveomyces insectorum RCEF 264 TaxID=1081102 RepID=A0A168A6Q4_9HYPO|nr:NADH-ubiquinone oxidoreductase [Niveomyces insectorum RCEF 264]